jgi:hypothetical protein
VIDRRRTWWTLPKQRIVNLQGTTKELEIIIRSTKKKPLFGGSILVAFCFFVVEK